MITVTAPNSSACSAVNVTVTTAGGTATSPDQFTFDCSY